MRSHSTTSVRTAEASTQRLIDQFLEYASLEKGLSPNTVASYKFDLRKLNAWATQKGVPVQRLTRTHLREYIQRLSREGHTPSSVKRMVSAARALFKFLVLDKHVKQSPAEFLDTPALGKPLPRFLTEDQLEKLLAAPDVSTFDGVRDRAMLELMYSSGLRVSELVSLKDGDISIDTRIVRVFGKGSKERLVPVGRSALWWLKRYQRARTRQRNSKSSEHLFVHSKTSGEQQVSRSHFWKLVKHYGEITGLKDVTPHWLRHTAATHMLQHGADIRVVQAFLGHSSIDTTQIYTHITSERLQTVYASHHPRATQNVRVPPKAAAKRADSVHSWRCSACGHIDRLPKTMSLSHSGVPERKKKKGRAN